jgi:hypothetical protein
MARICWGSAGRLEICGAESLDRTCVRVRLCGMNFRSTENLDVGVPPGGVKQVRRPGGTHFVCGKPKAILGGKKMVRRFDSPRHRKHERNSFSPLAPDGTVKHAAFHMLRFAVGVFAAPSHPLRATDSLPGQVRCALYPARRQLSILDRASPHIP